MLFFVRFCLILLIFFSSELVGLSLICFLILVNLKQIVDCVVFNYFHDEKTSLFHNPGSRLEYSVKGGI